VLAVLGYRIVNYWLPLPPGAIAYLRLRLRPGAGSKSKGKEKPPGGAAWLTVFRALISAERGVFFGARNICGLRLGGLSTLKPIAR
jgi:hypothetical protein